MKRTKDLKDIKKNKEILQQLKLNGVLDETTIVTSPIKKKSKVSRSVPKKIINEAKQLHSSGLSFKECADKIHTSHSLDIDEGILASECMKMTKKKTKRAYSKANVQLLRSSIKLVIDEYLTSKSADEWAKRVSSALGVKLSSRSLYNVIYTSGLKLSDFGPGFVERSQQKVPVIKINSEESTSSSIDFPVKKTEKKNVFLRILDAIFNS